MVFQWKTEKKSLGEKRWWWGTNSFKYIYIYSGLTFLVVTESYPGEKEGTEGVGSAIALGSGLFCLVIHYISFQPFLWSSTFMVATGNC